MVESLSKYGIYFDEVDKLCILKPEVLKHTNNLKDECGIYTEKIDEFQKITFNLVSIVERLASEVEKQKMKAIGAHNVLQNMDKQRESNVQQLQALIAEKSMELERSKIKLTSLQKMEMEQQEIINNLTRQ